MITILAGITHSHTHSHTSEILNISTMSLKYLLEAHHMHIELLLAHII